ncbi:hypothetical protein FRZ67_11640 [Panacibacter ginsenosidivorans]|uniref:Methylamine utilisation protein MauE domain-containing protein n=1 Tax=Panacibacter ginsenosidivorans TaxID=1813871 RepID=A0A5B8V8Q3_9BACT|nr:MauE/DoxX family redox-associated membrane protein [Panacibacter ginsenosidivorans]QEC67920.1 hypothetical protein FRZ67_11640 [Panacibacter ginsenosidivorans]
MKKIFPDIVAFLLIFLFTYTSINKLYSLDSFTAVLKAMPVIKPVAFILTWLIPSVELVVVALLFFPVTRLLGLQCSTALLLLFTLYLFYALAVSDDLPCSCGGIISSMTWKQHLLFNSTLILLTVTAVLFARRLEKKQKILLQ